MSKSVSALRIRGNEENAEYFLDVNLPGDILPRLRELAIVLSRSSYLTIHRLSPFSSLPSGIETLKLSGCGIKTLPFGSFQAFTKLQTLDLSLNALKNVPPDLLLYNPHLSSLNLSDNSLVYLPKLTQETSDRTLPTVDISRNRITCNCYNTWLHKQLTFIGFKCDSPLTPCVPEIHAKIQADVSTEPGSSSIPVLRGESLLLTCNISSSLPVTILWISPVGVVTAPPSSKNPTIVFPYNVQPLFAATVISVSRSSPSVSLMSIENLRGHLSGDWLCAGRSEIDLTVSSPLIIEVHSSFYLRNVYLTSLYYGYGTMLVLLLIGIIGGTIRYCKETHCMKQSQPPFNYGGKTFMGVIPVPGVDEEASSEKLDESITYDIDEGSLQYMSSGGLCKVCSKPPTYWFCVDCKAVHYAENCSTFQRRSSCCRK